MHLSKKLVAWSCFLCVLAVACSPASDSNLATDTQAASGQMTTQAGSRSDADQPEPDQPGTDEPLRTTESKDQGALQGDLGVEVLAQIPHDTEAYTQGLEFRDGQLLQSQGLRGRSARTWLDAGTGEVITRFDVQNDDIFAEGITLIGDEFVQLTWTAGHTIRGDIKDLEPNTTRDSYEGEGWGLCFDGTSLVMSNGTPELQFRDPDSFQLLKTINVADADGRPVTYLNELECVADQVLANVWGSDTIIVVNNQTGDVEAQFGASDLRPADTPFDLDHALNGIAYDRESGTYFITGKYWPVIYQLRLTSE